MDTRRGFRFLLIGLLGGALLGVPAAGAADDPPLDKPTTCADVWNGPAAGHELDQEIDLPDGGVAPGQVVTARMTWKTTDFDGDTPLNVALHCVQVNGTLDEALSTEDHNSPNDGEFTASFMVPDGLPAGTEICSRAAIAGNGGGYFERNRSDDVCLMVTAGSTTPPPVAEVPPPPEVVPQAPPAPAVPTEVLGATETAPAPAPAPAVAPPPAQVLSAPAELPRTGDEERRLLLLAGVLLALGGAAIGTTGKRTVRA